MMESIRRVTDITAAKMKTIAALSDLSAGSAKKISRTLQTEIQLDKHNGRSYTHYVKISSHISREQATLKSQAAIFQALSSTIRLAIVTLLYKEDLAVNRIVEKLREMDIPNTLDRTNVCKNLSLLKSMGIVSCRKDRQSRIYSLEARCLIDAMRCTLDLIAMRKKTNVAARRREEACGGCGCT